MANPSKKKGTQFEVDVTKYLWSHGQPEARRAALMGRKDQGDLHGIEGNLPARWRGIVECKAYADYPTPRAIMGAFKAQTFAERTNAGAVFALLVVKRPNRSIGEADAYVTLHGLAAMRGMRQLDGEPDDVWVRVSLEEACQLMGWSE